MIFYCSVGHQKEDWELNHKFNCIDYPREKKENNTYEAIIISEWYHNILRLPTTTLQQQKLVMLEFMTMYHIVALYKSLQANLKLLNAITLRMFEIGIQMKRDPVVLKTLLTSSQKGTTNKHVIAAFKQKLTMLCDEAVVNKLTIPCTKNIRSLETMERAQHYFAKYNGIRVVIDEKMNGLDVIADREFSKGDTIIMEKTFLAASLDVHGMCYHCCTVFQKTPTRCRNACGARYCDSTCEANAFVTYHGTLCSRIAFTFLQDFVSSHIKEDPESVIVVKYSLLLFKFCGMQMASNVPIWQQEPLCYFEPAQHLDDLKLRYALLPYNFFKRITLAVGSENNNYKQNSIDAAWCFRMTQYVMNNVFGSGYNELTIPVNTQEESSSLSFHHTATLFNHSCTPNIKKQDDEICVTTSFFVALKHIRKGEPLRISYLKSPTKQELREQYNFDCNCTRCQ